MTFQRTGGASIAGPVLIWNARRKDDNKKDGKKKKKSNEAEAPEVQMTTFASWEEVGRWYAGLEKSRREPTAVIKAKAAELTAGRTTDMDKIEGLYDYVATNFRYISLSFGVGRYQPHAAEDVLHNQYGDCKDKHTLLASLLEARRLPYLLGAHQLPPQAGSRHTVALPVRPRDQPGAARERRSVDGHDHRGRALPPAVL